MANWPMHGLILNFVRGDLHDKIVHKVARVLYGILSTIRNFYFGIVSVPHHITEGQNYIFV